MSIKLSDIEIMHQRMGDMELFKARLIQETSRRIPTRKWMRIPIDQMENERAIIAMGSRMAILMNLYGDLLKPVNKLLEIMEKSDDLKPAQKRRLTADIKAVFNGTTWEAEIEQ